MVFSAEAWFVQSILIKQEPVYHCETKKSISGVVLCQITASVVTDL